MKRVMSPPRIDTACAYKTQAQDTRFPHIAAA